MTVIAEFSVPSDEFALRDTLTAAPETIVEVERVVAHTDDRIMPYFWVRGGDYDDFEANVQSDPSVQDITRLDAFEDGHLYRAEWTQNIESIVYAYLNIGATILEATGRVDQWDLRMRFDEPGGVSEFRDYCTEQDISFELNRLYQPSDPMAGGQYELSPKQHDALVLALERGYFDVPRSVAMKELADEIGISQQSLSKRFRRAHHNLITNVLTVSHIGDEYPEE